MDTLAYFFIHLDFFAGRRLYQHQLYRYLGKTVNEDKRKVFFSTKQIIVGIVVLSSSFLAKKILNSSAYPVNFAFMLFAGASLLLIASGGFWKIKENIPSTSKIKGFREFIKTLRSDVRNLFTHQL